MNKKRRCLLCENAARTRGLCPKHHTQYTRARKELPSELRDEFDQAAIAAGKLLPVASDASNEFADVVEIVVRNNQQQRAADDATLNAAEAKANYRRGKKRPPSQESS